MCNSRGTKVSSSIVLIQSGSEWCLDYDDAENSLNTEFYCLVGLSVCESYTKYEFANLDIINEYIFYNYTNLNCELTGMTKINEIYSYCESLQFYETLWFQDQNEFAQIMKICKSNEIYFLNSKTNKIESMILDLNNRICKLK
jgi:hypothetical protein